MIAIRFRRVQTVRFYDITNALRVFCLFSTTAGVLAEPSLYSLDKHKTRQYGVDRSNPGGGADVSRPSVSGRDEGDEYERIKYNIILIERR